MRAVRGLARFVLAAVRVVALVAHAACVVLRVGVWAGCGLFVTHFFATVVFARTAILV